MGEITLKFDGTTITAYEDGIPIPGKSWQAISGSVKDGTTTYLDPQHTDRSKVSG